MHMINVKIIILWLNDLLLRKELVISDVFRKMFWNVRNNNRFSQHLNIKLRYNKNSKISRIKVSIYSIYLKEDLIHLIYIYSKLIQENIWKFYNLLNFLYINISIAYINITIFRLRGFVVIDYGIDMECAVDISFLFAWHWNSVNKASLRSRKKLNVRVRRQCANLRRHKRLQRSRIFESHNPK